MIGYEQAIGEFLKSKGLTPNSPISDEAGFYSEFVSWVWRRVNNVAPYPGIDALIGGYLRQKGLGPDSPVEPGGEQAFYEGFIAYVMSASQAVPVTAEQQRGWDNYTGGSHFKRK